MSEDWATPLMKEFPFWRDGMSPEEFDIEREHFYKWFNDVRENGWKLYAPLWKQKKRKTE